MLASYVNVTKCASIRGSILHARSWEVQSTWHVDGGAKGAQVEEGSHQVLPSSYHLQFSWWQSNTFTNDKDGNANLELPPALELQPLSVHDIFIFSLSLSLPTPDCQGESDYLNSTKKKQSPTTVGDQW
jgi:hypothetical protein